MLGFLFYRFISENLTRYLNADRAHRAGNTDFDYADLPDGQAMPVKDDVVAEKGFLLPLRPVR